MTYAMKDSGVEWIGMIPEHWEIKRIKDLFNIVSGGTPATNKNEYWNGDINWITPSDFKKNNGKYIVKTEKTITKLGFFEHGMKKVPKNSIVMSTRASVGYIGLILEDSCISQSCESFVSKDKNDCFIFNYFNFLNLSQEIIKKSYGTTFKAITKSYFQNFEILNPPKKEQEIIASYLDKHVGNLDKYIDSAEKKIKLLEEQKTALIYETVTRGLNPDVKMKDSGIEWIGMIPEHWEVKRVKNFFKLSMGKTILKEDLKENGSIPVYSATAEDKYFGYLEKSNNLMKRGDLVIPARGSIGFIKRAKNNSISTQTTIIARNKSIQYNDFCFYYLNGLRNQIFKYDQTAIPQVTVFQVGGYFLLNPPQKEQKDIASYLDTKCSRIKKEVELLKKKVELLKEYKTSLIFEVVTGKKSVV